MVRKVEFKKDDYTISFFWNNDLPDWSLYCGLVEKGNDLISFCNLATDYGVANFIQKICEINEWTCTASDVIDERKE